MIRLEDVSTHRFIMDNKDDCDRRIWYACRLLINHKITDYRKLEDFLQSELANQLSKKDAYYSDGIMILRSELAIIKRKLDRFNKKEKEVEIFDFSSPITSEIDDETLDITDRRNKGKILLCRSPIILGSGINSIRKLPISQIKHLIGHVDPTNFKNCLLNLEGIGKKELEDIERAIWFNEEQVVRQVVETGARNTNVFFLNMQAKRQLAEEQIKEIAEYIASNAKECVWGKLTASEKRLLLKATLGSSEEDMIKIRGSFREAICRHTTLGELETGLLKEQEVVTVVGGVKTKERKIPIDRFIIEKR